MGDWGSFPGRGECFFLPQRPLDRLCSMCGGEGFKNQINLASIAPVSLLGMNNFAAQIC